MPKIVTAIAFWLSAIALIPGLFAGLTFHLVLRKTSLYYLSIVLTGVAGFIATGINWTILWKMSNLSSILQVAGISAVIFLALATLRCLWLASLPPPDYNNRHLPIDLLYFTGGYALASFLVFIVLLSASGVL